MNLNENQSSGKELLEQMKSTNTSAFGMQETKQQKPQSKTNVALKDVQVLVSERQFETVKEELSESLNLLNSSGHALLKAIDQMIPPPGSSRNVGEYTAQGIRKLSKSLCEIILTKQQVVKAVYSIARDDL